MTILDLTEDYIALRAQGRGYREYGRLYPSLFEHYFRYWCPGEREELAIADEEIRKRAQRVLRAIGEVEELFESRGVYAGDTTVALFVGKNTSNGHAFLDGDKWVVWLPVETYTSDSLARVFVVHEIAHALHYQLSSGPERHANPGLYFDDHESKSNIGRQLITEGLATYVTAEVLGVSDIEALWAAYLSQDNAEAWMAECVKRDGELRNFCREHFDESIADCEIFMANDPDDILKFRAGYYLGLSIVRNIAEKEDLCLLGLLSLDSERFPQLVRDELGRTRL